MFQDMSVHTPSMISISTTTNRISEDSKIQQASRDGKKINYAKFSLDPTNPKKKNKEEKKIEKKNLSPGDGFSSGIV
jgi:hypothetical protein